MDYLRLLEVKDEVRACTSCELHETCKSPVPVSTGSTPGLYVVVGQSPGVMEDHKNKPFVGPAGKLLRKMLKAAGLNPDHGCYMNVVCCMPKGTKDNKHGITREQIDACNGNFQAQLEASDTEFVLACGTYALHKFLPRAELRYAIGGMFHLDGRWVMPVFHPSFIMHNPKAEPTLADNIRLFSLVVGGHMDPSWLNLDLCIYCGGTAYDKVSACRKHQKVYHTEVNKLTNKQEKLL